jgi:hypothetical protein
LPAEISTISTGEPLKGEVKRSAWESEADDTSDGDPDAVEPAGWFVQPVNHPRARNTLRMANGVVFMCVITCSALQVFAAQVPSCPSLAEEYRRGAEHHREAAILAALATIQRLFSAVLRASAVVCRIC